MADSKLRVNLIGDASSLNRSLQIATKRLDAFGQRATQIGKDLSLRLTLPIGLAAGAAIKMASDMEESTNKVRVAFGDSSKQVEAFAKTALRSFGIAESSALDMTALFGDMATGMGVSQNQAAALSTRLVGLAGDLASFKNINIEEVTTALSGVFTGETESLKRLGIVMTEVNLEQFRMQQNIRKSVKEMTQQEKIMLRLNYIFSVTKNAQGDFARTSEGAANQMRTLSESLKEVGADLGSIMLPQFTAAITRVNELVKEFRALDDETKTLIVQIGLFAAAVPPLVFIVGQLTISIGALYTAISKLPAVFGGLTAAITIGVTAFNQLSKAIAPNLNFFERFAVALQFFGQPQMIAGALALADGVAQVEDQIKKTTKTQEDLRAAFGGDPFGAAVLPFGRGDAVKMPKPVGEDQALKNMQLAADKAAASLDALLATDSNLTFALASDAAAVEYFGNVVKQTAEEVRTPLEILREKFKDLSEASVNMVMQVGASLQNAFNNMLNGENVFKSLANSLGDLIKRLIAAAAAAALLSLFLGGTSALEFLGGFKGIFGSLSGLGSFSPGSAIGSPGGSGFGMGNLGIQGAMRGNTVNVAGQFRIDGQDLVVAVERANNQRSNFTG